MLIIFLLYIAARHALGNVLIREPDVNAVPAAGASQATKDWLSGGPIQEQTTKETKAKEDEVDTSRAMEHIEKPSAPREDASPRNTTQVLQQPRITTQDTSTDAKRPSESCDNATPETIAQSMQQPGVMTQETYTDTNNLPLATSAPSASIFNPNEEQGRLELIKKFELVQAKRKVHYDEVPDLMDVDSPSLKPANKAFDAEDVPCSLQPPLLPSHYQIKGLMAPIEEKEEDLLKFQDARDGSNFGILIPTPPRYSDNENAFNRAINEAKTWEGVQPSTRIRAKVEVATDIEKKLRAAAEAQASKFAGVQKSEMSQGLLNSKWAPSQSRKEVRPSVDVASITMTDATVALGPLSKKKNCSCTGTKSTNSVQGLASSKWASPGYHHQGKFPRNTEILDHEIGCPVRSSWEKDHPLDSGTNPATYDGADGGTMQVQPKENRTLEKFNSVWSPKVKKLSPYALPFVPSMS